MCPSNSTDYLADGGLRDSIFFCQTRLAEPVRVKLSDLSNFIFAKNRTSVALTVWGIISSLPRPILRIIFGRPKKKMVWIAAWRIVTYMTNKNSFRNWPKNNLPDQAVGQNISFFVGSPSVPACSDIKFPWPAIFWLRVADSIKYILWHFHNVTVGLNSYIVKRF